MATRITLLNDDNAVWNDRDFMTWYKDFITNRGAGFLNVHREIEHLQNAGFEEGTGSIAASDWIGSDAYNAWYGFIAGTCAISFDASNFDEGAQSLKIDQTVNSGAQVSGVRLTANASGFDETDFRHLIPVNGGKDIRLAFALKTSSVTAGSGKGAQAAIQAYDADGMATGSEQTSTLVTGTQAFTDDTLDVTLPDDAAYIQVTLRIVNTTGTAWFDSLVLTERGTDIEVTAQAPSAADLDIATGICFFEITDGDGNVFMVRFEVETAETVTITNNTDPNPRIDVVYAYYDNSADADIDASNVGSIEVVVGTPGASPTAPSVPANGIKIAEVYVAAGASVFDESTVTDYRVPVTTRNVRTANAMGQGDAMSYEQAKAPATEVQMGQVVVVGTPTDPARPKVPSMEYGGLPTPEELVQLLSAIPTKDFTLGEDFPINNFPFIAQETYTSTPDVEQIYTTNWFGQTFTVPTGVTSINYIDLLGRQKGSLAETDNITVEIYATSAGLPTGSVLASATRVAREIGYSGPNTDFGDYAASEWTRWTLSSELTVTPGTVYAIVVHLSGGIGSSTNNYSWAYSSSSVLSGGNKVSSTNSGSSWSSSSSHDFCFRLFGKYTGIYPFYLEDGQHTEIAILQNTNTNLSAGVPSKVYTTRQQGQTFRVRGIDYLSKIKVQVETAAAASGYSAAVTFSIFACDANGAPTGTALWTDATTTGIIIAAAALNTLTFTPNIAVTDGEQYCLTMQMPSAGDATNYIYMYHSDTTTANGGSMPESFMTTSTDGGATWGASVKADVAMTVYGYKSRTAGRVYRADPGHPDRQRIIGWATDTTPLSAGETISLACGDAVAGLDQINAALTPYMAYFLAANGYELTTTPPSVPGMTTAHTYIHRKYANGGVLWAGKAIAADELSNYDRHGMQLMWAATDGDQAYTTSDTSYIQAPKDARFAVVSLKTGSTREEKGEIILDKYGKTTGTFSGTDTSTAYTVTATWDATNNRIAITCTGGTRSQSYAYFYR